MAAAGAPTRAPRPAKTWHDDPTRFLFFTGKGGVGKTSLACATAVKLADEGKRVLLVSTDPASNLEHVFGVEIGEQVPTAIPGTPLLDALNIDPEGAAEAYRERLLGPVRDVLPESALRKMEEELSGACTTEIAAFDEFTGLLADPAKISAYEHVIFDTAPTGHTLRLLKLPTAWSSFLDSNTSGSSCLGPLAGLDKQRELYREAVDSLADAKRTTLVLVARAQKAALDEAARTSHELGALGATNQRLVLNGLMPDTGSGDHLAIAMRRRDQAALDQLPEILAGLPMDSVELQSFNVLGLESLRGLLRPPGDSAGNKPFAPDSPAAMDAPCLSGLVDQIEADGHGLVMVMGKGGVGKTTIAAAIAVELASRGHETHLSTTDPAAHVAQAVAAEVEHLEVSRIDPQAETKRYTDEILASKGKDMDEDSLAMLREDLRSPCTEEIAVFQAFSRVIREARRKFIVLDTAPTGHTLLLIDATGSYHRDIVRHVKPGAKVLTPMMRLQDPAQTKVLVATLAETTPVLEAAALQEDLRRAGIEPWAWVVNASLAAARPTDPLLVARAEAEREQIALVRDQHSRRLAVIAWQPEEPVGPARLRALLTHEPAAT